MLLSGRYPKPSRLRVASEVIKYAAIAVLGINIGHLAHIGPWWAPVILAVITLASIAFYTRDALTEWRHQYFRGAIAVAASINRVECCDHQWSRHRDERSEALSWKCTECHAERAI